MSVVSAWLWHATGTVRSPPPVPVCSSSPGLVSPCVHTCEDQHDEHKDADTHQVAVEPGITITAPRTASRDIRRHKASSYG
jgi:hypothetical protein